MSNVSIDKTYKTRDGRAARILCVDRKGQQPVLALLSDGVGEETVLGFNADGTYSTAHTAHRADLIEVVPDQIRYMTLRRRGDIIDASGMFLDPANCPRLPDTLVKLKVTIPGDGPTTVEVLQP